MKLLGDEAWAVLIKISEVYEKEKKECLAAIKTLKYFSDAILDAIEDYSCTKCGTDLIMPQKKNMDAIEANFECRECGKVLLYEDIIKPAISNYYSHAVYFSHTDGDDLPITDCPKCDGIYLYNEGVCSSCGYEAEHRCQRCSSTIMPDELSTEPFCEYCAYVMSKDD